MGKWEWILGNNLLRNIRKNLIQTIRMTIKADIETGG